MDGKLKKSEMEGKLKKTEIEDKWKKTEMEGKWRKSEMEGKVVIITGSSSGIGEATALLLASQGAKVTIHGRKSDKLSEVAKKVKEASPSKCEPCCVLGNIQDPAVRRRLVQATLEKFHRIDGLVNNAGWCSLGGWKSEDLGTMQEMLDIHVIGPYDLCRKVMPQLIANKGSIVMVTSIAGVRGVPGAVSYVTAKHAMEGLMKALAIETASRGVRVNSVNPGMVATDFFRYVEWKTLLEEFDPKKIHPNRRIGEPYEVANSIAFLLSPGASMISGAGLSVDGAASSSAMW